ncbi:MAG: hypothetical protein HDS45_04740 [Bacteroides sp.]|nr:hypothetical protein [Bacteroides sp.]
MIKIKNIIIIAVAVIAIGAIALYLFNPAPKKTIDVSKGKINDVATLAQLCAIDIYSEVPILDTINNKVMFAVQKQKGSISFDIENMQVDAEGDTVKITLSPEIVDLYEATEDNSWEVIDTKAIGNMALFRSDKLTIEEENALKAKIRRNSKKLLYHNGTIRRARAEGAKNLQTLMEKVYRKPVKVVDPTPKGAHYEEFK